MVQVVFDLEEGKNRSGGGSHTDSDAGCVRCVGEVDESGRAE